MIKQKHSPPFPNNLKQFRNLRGYERAEIAERLNLTRAKKISLWEKGVLMPDAINLFKLCILYDANPLELYRGVMTRLNAFLNEENENLPTIDF